MSMLPACFLLLLSILPLAAMEFPLPAGRFIPARMPMHLVYPRPDAETQAHARHRWAHPGMRYEIPIGVQGGAWPFRYELVGAPAGARIGALPGEADYGVVSWTPAAADPVTFTVRITDQELHTVEAVWRVTVDAAPFLFIKSGWTGERTGTIDAPLASLAEWYKDSVDDATFRNRIVVLRGGSYEQIGNPAEKGNLRLKPETKTPSLIGFPGEEPVVDASRSKVMVGDLQDIFVAGITWRNARQDVANAHYFWLTGEVSRCTFWRNHFTDMGPGTAGDDNTGPVFISRSDTVKENILYKGNLLSGIRNSKGNGHYFDIYRANHILVEENTIRDSVTDYGLWLKCSIGFGTIRANQAFERVGGRQISIGYGTAGGELPHDHEICWNRVVINGSEGASMQFAGSDSYKGKTYNSFIYRNTFVNGFASVRFPGRTPYETDGNVVVTTQAKHWDVAGMKTVVPNLLAAPKDGVVTEDGTLVDRTRVGSVGFEIAP